MREHAVGEAGCITRRTFLGHTATLLGAGAALLAGAVKAGRPAPTGAAARGTPRGHPSASRPPVVSFHIDRPYLDLSATADPYIPPAGARSGEPAAALSDTEFWRRYVYC
jgi:hypothetical protein